MTQWSTAAAVPLNWDLCILVLWRYEILARRSILVRFWTKNRDFDSIRFFRVQYRESTQFGTSHPKLSLRQYTASIENRQLYNLYSLSKWTIIMLFIYVNLEEKPTINLCLKSMLCLLLFTSCARHYVNNGLLSGFLNYALYVRNARSCVAAKKRNMTKSKHDLANITISILVDFDKKSRFSISILRSSQH